MLKYKRKDCRMLVYLDNCCYNRPYDDQTQLKISIETQAKLRIQNLIKDRKMDLATSYISFYENSKNTQDFKRKSIESFMKRNAKINIHSDKSDEIEAKANEIMATGVKPYDAYHVAAAIIAGCDYFFTTDRRLLKFKTEEVIMANPVDVLEILEELE